MIHEMRNKWGIAPNKLSVEPPLHPASCIPPAPVVIVTDFAKIPGRIYKHD